MPHTTDHRFDAAALLARTALFEELSPARLAVIAERTRSKRLAKGETLFQKGDSAHGFYVIASGQIKLAFPSSNGNEKVVDIVGELQSFGEAVMLAQQVYPVFAQALAESQLLFVAREEALALLENEPAFARRMLIGLAMHNHALVNDIESYTLRTSTERVICHLLHRCCCDEDCVEIALSASKQVTASRLNLTPETFSRILHEIAGAGLIEIDGRRILIRSVARLRAAVTAQRLGRPTPANDPGWVHRCNSAG